MERRPNTLSDPPSERRFQTAFGGSLVSNNSRGDSAEMSSLRRNIYTNSRGPYHTSIGTPFEWQRQITAFFERTPTQREMPAAEFILRARVDTDGKTSLEGRDAETHGPYDGLCWQQMRGTGGAAEQRGFISGYLWCHAELCKNKGGAFSKTPEQYVGLVTRWYESRPRSGKGVADHQRRKIAEVLRRFRDRNMPSMTDEKGAEKLRIGGSVS